jgi:hypothetical protein
MHGDVSVLEIGISCTLFGDVIYGIVGQSWVKDGHRNEIKENTLSLDPPARVRGNIRSLIDL